MSTPVGAPGVSASAQQSVEDLFARMRVDADGRHHPEDFANLTRAVQQKLSISDYSVAEALAQVYSQKMSLNEQPGASEVPKRGRLPSRSSTTFGLCEDRRSRSPGPKENDTAGSFQASKGQSPAREAPAASPGRVLRASSLGNRSRSRSPDRKIHMSVSVTDQASSFSGNAPAGPSHSMPARGTGEFQRERSRSPRDNDGQATNNLADQSPPRPQDAGSGNLMSTRMTPFLKRQDVSKGDSPAAAPMAYATADRSVSSDGLSGFGSTPPNSLGSFSSPSPTFNQATPGPTPGVVDMSYSFSSPPPTAAMSQRKSKNKLTNPRRYGLGSASSKAGNYSAAGNATLNISTNSTPFVNGWNAQPTPSPKSPFHAPHDFLSPSFQPRGLPTPSKKFATPPSGDSGGNSGLPTSNAAHATAAPTDQFNPTPSDAANKKRCQNATPTWVPEAKDDGVVPMSTSPVSYSAARTVLDANLSSAVPVAPNLNIAAGSSFAASNPLTIPSVAGINLTGSTAMPHGGGIGNPAIGVDFGVGGGTNRRMSPRKAGQRGKKKGVSFKRTPTKQPIKAQEHSNTFANPTLSGTVKPVPPQSPKPVPSVTFLPQDHTATFHLGTGAHLAKGRRGPARRARGVARLPVAQPSIDSHVQAAEELKAEQEREWSEIISKKREMAMHIREKAEEMYGNGDFCASIVTYSAAIKELGGTVDDSLNDIFAVLLSNRAAAFIMIQAFEAAVDDCKTALQVVPREPSEEHMVRQPGTIAVERPKLLLRTGNALLQLGDSKSALEYLDQARDYAEKASAICGSVGKLAGRQKFYLDILEEIYAIRMKALKLDHLRSTIEQNSLTSRGGSPASKRRMKVMSLDSVESALVIAPRSSSLHLTKCTLLGELRRWREVASHCERLAAANVLFDKAFAGDLRSRHPYSGIPPAVSLDPMFFGDRTEERFVAGATKQLQHEAAAEAILRIPLELMSHYARALRLEERYTQLNAVLAKTGDLLEAVKGTPAMTKYLPHLQWRSEELRKTAATTDTRQLADNLFREGKYTNAAAKYAEILQIDSGEAGAERVGGKLHAIAFCNRAACLMALNRFPEALEACTAALRIHEYYMKAMSRRARCYSKLNRFEEAILEYRKWTNLAKGQSSVLPENIRADTPCIFDMPHEVSDQDIAKIEAELDATTKAQAAQKEAEARKRFQEHARKSHSSWRSAFWSSTTSDAQARRDRFYENGHGSSRGFDPFEGRFPKRGSGSRQRNRDPPGASMRKKVVSPEKTYYEVLGLTRSATLAQIKRAYREMALKYHPDKVSETDKEAATAKFHKISEAYDTLSDTTKRLLYDDNLARGRTGR